MGTEEEKSVEISSQEMFDSAVADEPEVEAKPEEEQTPSEPEAKPEGERQRDAKGRFVGKEEEGGEPTEPEAKAEAEPEPQPEPTQPEAEEAKADHRIPLNELLNEREKRQNAEREMEQLRQHLWQMQSQAKQATPEEPVDIFADPDAYQQKVGQTMEDRFRAMEGNFSLRLANYKHGDTFQEAWQDMVNRTMNGDDSLRQQVLNSTDPGETLVQLYQREKVMSEVGNDPMSYVNKKLEEALDNPEFLAKALEKAKAQAGSKPEQNKIALPPSLNKATASASDRDGVDASDEGIYNFATGR